MMAATPLARAYELRGILFVLSGPSGVGKDTVLRHAMSRLGPIRTSVSVTTRPPRPDEIDGTDYFFVSVAEYQRMLEARELLEHAEVHGHFYGTPRTWVLDHLRAGTDVVLEIDVQGAMQVKAAFPEVVLLFLGPPSWQELARRLRARGTDDEESIRRRLRNAHHEMQQINRYDYLIINDQLAYATDRFQAIVLAERCRPARQEITHLLAEGSYDL